MDRQAKIEKVRRIGEGLEKSEASFIFNYHGLKVTELTELRKMLRGVGARFYVVKNNLAHRAIERIGLDDLNQFFSGGTGIIFVEKDPLASAKIVKGFILDHPNLVIKGGVLGRDILKGDEVRRLGDIPSREVLLSWLLTGMQSPVRRLLGILNSPLGNLVLLLQSILSKKKSNDSPQSSQIKEDD